jgi:CheY-like chemotaxis protein
LLCGDVRSHDPHRLAVLLGGDLHITDRTDGMRGARFRLRLPLRVPQRVPSPVNAAPQRGSGAGLPHGGSLLSSGAEAAAAALAASDDAGRGSFLLKQLVLLVDDSEGNRRLGRRMLQQLGCLVVEARDGDEVPAALAAAAREAGRGVDVVLMDIEMTRLGGVGAVAEMRRAGETVPVLAVTGHADDDDVVSCMSPPRDQINPHHQHHINIFHINSTQTKSNQIKSQKLTRACCAAVLSHGFDGVLCKPFSREKLRAALLPHCRPRHTSPAVRARRGPAVLAGRREDVLVPMS